MTVIERLRKFIAWVDSPGQIGTYQQSDDNGDGTSRVMIEASHTSWGVTVRLEVLRSILVELELWQWLTDMACTVQANSDINAMKWAVVDVDGEIIGVGNTPVEAIENAK